MCHVQTIYDPEKCVVCNRCVDVCPEHCLALVPLADLDLDEAIREAVVQRAESDGLPLSAMLPVAKRGSSVPRSRCFRAIPWAAAPGCS